jgi:hypothetical protein
LKVEDFALTISKWLRLSFERFLNTEPPVWWGLRIGRVKVLGNRTVSRMLHASVKASLRTADAALGRGNVVEAWTFPASHRECLGKEVLDRVHDQDLLRQIPGNVQ